MALKVIDDAMQAHGAEASARIRRLPQVGRMRTLRLADGPDEVHSRAIARLEFAKHAPA